MTKWRNEKLVKIYERRLRIKLQRIRQQNDVPSSPVFDNSDEAVAWLKSISEHTFKVAVK